MHGISSGLVGEIRLRRMLSSVRWVENNAPTREMKDRFLLFAIARSGCTTLMRLLNCHPEIRCIDEPFNLNNFQGQYFERVKDVASLDETLEDIWRCHNGIKHAWDPTGTPFTLRPYLNEHLVLRSDQKILFLNRRNTLRRIVSLRIAQQTQIWHVTNKSDRSRLANFEFQPINTSYLDMGCFLELEREIIASYKQLLTGHNADFLELWYEDLYESGLTAGEKLDRLNEILRFLGKSPITDEATVSAVNALFDPGNSKLNSPDTYRKIPGIDEVERQFGSDETGWLFK